MAEERDIILRLKAQGFETIKDLEARLKDVNKQFKEAAIGTDAYNTLEKESKQLTADLKLLTDATKANTKSLGGVNEAAKFVKGSYGELRQRIKALKAEQDTLIIGSVEFTKNQESLNGALQEEIDLRKLQPSLFKERVKGALDESEVLNKQAEALKKISEGFAGASLIGGNLAKTFGASEEAVEGLIGGSEKIVRNFDAFKKIAEGLTGQNKGLIKSLFGIKEAQEGITTATNTGSKASKIFGITLKGALIASGIGALIVGLGLLIENFDKLGSAADKIKEIFSGLKEAAIQVFKNLAQIVVNYKDLIFSIFDPESGSTKAALKKLIKSYTEIGKGVGDAYSNGVQQAIDARNLELLKSQTELNNGLREQSIRLLDAQLSDESKSFEKRKKIAQDKLALQKQSIDAEINLLNQKAKVEGELSNEDKIRLQSLIADKKLLQSDYTKFISDEAQKQFDIQVEASKRSEKAEQDLIQFRIEQQILLAVSIEDRVNKEIELENFRAAVLLENTELTEDERQLIIERSNTAIFAINKKGVDDRKALSQEEFNDLFQLASFRQEQVIKGLNEELKATDTTLQRKLQIIDEVGQKQLALERARLQVELEDINKSETDKQLLQEQFDSKEIELNKKTEEVKRAEIEITEGIEKEKAIAILNTTANVFGTIGGFFEENSQAAKKFAILQGTADAFGAAIAALKSTASIPGVGPVLAPIAAASTLAVGLTNVSKIASLEQGGKVKKFSIGGKRHAHGGTKFAGEDGTMFEAEAGEDLYVVKRNDRMMIKGLSMENVRRGGIPFMDAGGVISRSFAQPVRKEVNQQQQLQNFIKNIPNPVVSVKEITKSQKRVNLKENNSKL